MARLAIAAPSPHPFPYSRAGRLGCLAYLDPRHPALATRGGGVGSSQAGTLATAQVLPDRLWGGRANFLGKKWYREGWMEAALGAGVKAIFETGRGLIAAKAALAPANMRR